MYKLEVLDFRHKAFSDAAAQDILSRVAAGERDQIQLLCDSQMLADCLRTILLKHALADGRHFEMTILGMGAAVGVKMFTGAMKADAQGKI